MRKCHQDADRVDHDVDLSCKVLDRDRTVEQAFVNATLGDRALDRSSLFSSEGGFDGADARGEVCACSELSDRISGLNQIVVPHACIVAIRRIARLASIVHRIG